MHVCLVDARFLNGDGLCLCRIGDRDGSLARLCLDTCRRVKQQPIVITCCPDRDTKVSLLGELAQGDLEICLRPVGTFHLEHLGTGDCRPEDQSLGNSLVRQPLGIPRIASHAGKNRMVDAVVLPPSPYRIITLVPLDETKLRLHGKGFKIEWLVRPGLGDHKVIIFQQVIVGTQDQLVREGVRVECFPQVHAKFLDHGP